MGEEAETVINKARSLSEQDEPQGKDMLCFFKHEYAVFCSLDYLNLLRELLSSQLSKL